MGLSPVSVIGHCEQARPPYTPRAGGKSAAELRDIRKSYHWILGRMTAALPGVTLAGPSDLAIGDRKIGGSAQQRKREHHRVGAAA